MSCIVIKLYRNILRDFKKLTPNFSFKYGIITIDDYIKYSTYFNNKIEYYDYFSDYDEYNSNLRLPIVYNDKYKNALSFLKYRIKVSDEKHIDDLFEVYKNLEDYHDDIKHILN